MLAAVGAIYSAWNRARMQLTHHQVGVARRSNLVTHFKMGGIEREGASPENSELLGCHITDGEIYNFLFLIGFEDAWK